MSTTTDTTSTDVAEFLRLLVEPREVFEVRILKCKLHNWGKGVTVAGFFDDVDEAAKQIASIENECKPPGIYVTLNPCRDELFARSPNRLIELDAATQDIHVIKRRWLFLDIDSGAASGISATDSQRDAALSLAEEVRCELERDGWPEPLRGMSGNGAYLLYRIELPNDADGNALYKRTLQSLAERFNIKGAAKLDTSTVNPARIAKVLGTWARKGTDFRGTESREARPHRRSYFIVPDGDIQIVRRELLEALPEPTTTKPPGTISNGNHHHGNGSTFDLRGFLVRHGIEVANELPFSGGTKFQLARCPFNPDHRSPDSYVAQYPSGGTDFKCSHNSCSGYRWQQFRDHFEPGYLHRKQLKSDVTSELSKFLGSPAESRLHDETLNPIPASTLITENPKLAEPVIEGLLRRGETANLIAAPKVGKSWLSYDLGLSMATGGRWLGAFTCRPGRVLIIDNELHPATLAHRIPTSADGLGIRADDYRDGLELLPLRGRLLDLFGIARLLRDVEPGQYDLIILDAFYRAIPGGTSENDNASVAGLYNSIDQIAARLNCAWLNIHHASKGSQADKSVSDVGAGAGAQSRAADTHIVLRPHQEQGVIVLDAVCRSFPPVDPLPLRWEFPVFVPTDNVDPSALLGKLTVNERRQGERDAKGKADILTMLDSGPATARAIRMTTGISKDRCDKLLHQLEAAEQIIGETVIVRGNESREFRLQSHVVD